MSAKDRKHPRCTVTERLVVPAKQIEALLGFIKPTGQSMRIAKRKGSESFSRFVLRGVPAKHVDFVVQDAIILRSESHEIEQGCRLVEFQTWSPEGLKGEFQSMLVELGIKKGGYDLKERDRISIKGGLAHCALEYKPATL